jgi:hypothetical protein
VEVRAVRLDRLRPAEWNSNRPGPELVRKLRRSIERFGLVSNLVVRKHPTRRGAFEVLSGNHRLELLRELGFDEAPVVVVDVDDARARLLAVALNRGGSDDPIAYAKLVADVIDALGSTDELEELLPVTAETLEAALARLEELPPPVPRDDAYPLLDTWALGFKLEAALACRRRSAALALGEEREALGWWYGHVFDRVHVGAGVLEAVDFVDFDDTRGADLELVFAAPGERVLAFVGTAKRALSAHVRKAAAGRAELELLALDEHDDLVFGSWRATAA